MKRIESVKCNMIHEDLSTVIDEIQFEEARLIHEHYFVPLRLKGLIILLSVVLLVAIIIVRFVVN